MNEYECEFGTCGNVKFIDSKNVKSYDEKENEICIPKCNKCGYHKAQIIGQNSSAWICVCCGVQ